MEKIADVAFKGTLNQSQEIAAVPEDLLTFLTLLIEGSALPGPTVSRAALTSAEIIVYNFRKTVARKTTKDVMRRHSPHLEPPLQVYLAMKIHITVKSKAMVNVFHGLGLCISYRRLLEIYTSMANMHISTYRERDIVCPPNMVNGLVTGICFDNIDENTKSTTSRSTFHGTAITVNQLKPVKNDDGDEESQGAPPISIDAVYKNHPHYQISMV